VLLKRACESSVSADRVLKTRHDTQQVGRNDEEEAWKDSHHIPRGESSKEKRDGRILLYDTHTRTHTGSYTHTYTLSYLSAFFQDLFLCQIERIPHQLRPVSDVHLNQLRACRREGWGDEGSGR
jgi:hypothetical protein